LCWNLLTVKAQAQPSESSQTLEQQAYTRYEAGDLATAIQLLQQAVQLHQTEPLQQAVSLANLALVYQQAGQPQAANQVIASSLEKLQTTQTSQTDKQQVLVQVLSIQARLQLEQGQSEAALSTWEQSAALYQQLGDKTGELQSQLNQAQALQNLGFYRRAIALLNKLNDTTSDPELRQPALRAAILRSLGDALRVTGDLTRSRQVLEQSQQFIASAPAEAAATDISLANLIRAEAIAQLSLSGLSISNLSQSILNQSQSTQTNTPAASLSEAALQQRQRAATQQFVQQLEAAARLYQQAEQSASLQTKVQAQLNRLDLLVALQRWAEAKTLIAALYLQLNNLPLNQTRLSQQINLGLNWFKVAQATSSDQNSNQDIQQIIQFLSSVVQQAASLSDTRMQSFGLGSLGYLYEQMQQWAAAQQTTEQALSISQAINAADLSYRWQWQLGRLLKRQNNRTGAIAAYTEAVKSLQALRNDLVAINRDVQFSFQEQVEPVYRELVGLLLPKQENAALDELLQARQVIEGLQIAELDNFFREACLETQFEIDRVVDRANLSAAIFYTIVLPDRLEIILKLPEQKLLRYSTAVEQETVVATVNELLTELKRPYRSQRGLVLSQQVYDWLIRPALPQLGHVETLVFVLDDALRSLPLAALYDGQHYLIETYSVALAPGLQLTDPKPLQARRFNILLAGLSEARANFSALKYVAREVKQIQAELPSKVLFNESFTEANLQQQLDRSAYSIVHIATHGQFSSNAANTFILAWDQPITVNELSSLLQSETINSAQPIELLVLSACRTATGDRRAALGMAGVAVRAGARSTIASFWNLDDDSGAVLMQQFYQELTQHSLSKAEALRRAQIALLQNPQYAAPRFWAAYILLGNWL
jgi:CHAT domain-containing protein